MIKVFYWSPYLSHVATIKNVINSALTLTKYNKNYQVSLIDSIGEWEIFREKLKNNRVSVESLNNLKLKGDKVGFLKSRLYFLFILIYNFIPLINLLKKKKPDFILIHLLTSLPLIILFLFKLKTKFILRISGLPKLNFYRKFLWKLISKKIYLVTCPSKETLDNLKKLNIFENKKLVVLYDPIINVSTISKKKKKKIDINLESNFFLNIGRLTNQKNQIILIKLFNRLAKKEIHQKLFIIGTGENKNYLLQKIKKFNLQNKIFLLGHKKNVFPYIKKAKACILSSLWEDPGAVMVESAFCNTTIISSDCPNGPSEFLDNNKGGYLFKSNDILSLEKVFYQFMNDSKKKIYDKKIYAKKKSKIYSCFGHYLELNRILNE